MAEFIVVGIGGFLGAVLRYLCSILASTLSAALQFPLGTLIVNVIGCFAIGAISRAIEKRGALSPQQRLFLIPGLIGGFTTFSAFGYETITQWELHGALAAGGNVAANLVLGLLAVVAGRLFADSLL